MYAGPLFGHGSYSNSVTGPNLTNSKDVIYNLETDNFSNYKNKNIPDDLSYYSAKLISGVKLGAGVSGKNTVNYNLFQEFLFPKHFRYYLIGIGFESEIEYQYFDGFSAYSYSFSGMYTFLFPVWIKFSIGKMYTDEPVEYVKHYDINVQNKTRRAVTTDSKYFDTLDISAVFYLDLSEKFSLYFEAGGNSLNRNKDDEIFNGSTLNAGVIYHFINI